MPNSLFRVERCANCAGAWMKGRIGPEISGWKSAGVVRRLLILGRFRLAIQPARKVSASKVSAGTPTALLRVEHRENQCSGAVEHVTPQHLVALLVEASGCGEVACRCDDEGQRKRYC